MDARVTGPARASGEFTLPGDKSISHRALMLASLAHGTSTLTNLAPGADVASTVRCLRDLGARIDIEFGSDGTPVATVHGRGIELLRASALPLDCGNSGTTARLLAGLLTAVPGTHVLIGDASLSRRPMERVVAPLRKLGASIRGTGSPARLPLEIRGGHGATSTTASMLASEWVHVAPNGDVSFATSRITGTMIRASLGISGLSGGRIGTSVSSAQVKSALMLAALHGSGPLTIDEPSPTRDHTERMMAAMGIRVSSRSSGRGMAITVEPGTPKPRNMNIPGDPSAAAFMLALGVHPSSGGVTVRNVGLNPGRIGFLSVLRRMGANVVIEPNHHPSFEPAGTITARPSTLVGTTIEPEEVPSLIDELPLVAALATQAHGDTVVRGASELRVKESDRIMAMCRGLSAMGARISPLPDGFVVNGPVVLRGGVELSPIVVESEGDHRIAMSLAVAATWCRPGVGADWSHVLVRGAECASISDPAFWERLDAASQ